MNMFDTPLTMEDEVGHGRRVDRGRLAGGRVRRRSRDHARRVDVAEEDAPVRDEEAGTTLSSMRAPPPSLRPTSGAHGLRESHDLAQLLAETSPSAPPKIVKSWIEDKHLAAVDSPQPVITPSVSGRFSSMPKPWREVAAGRACRARRRCRDRAAGRCRSRAVSFPRLCWRRTDASLAEDRASSLRFGELLEAVVQWVSTVGHDEGYRPPFSRVSRRRRWRQHRRLGRPLSAVVLIRRRCRVARPAPPGARQLSDFGTTPTRRALRRPRGPRPPNQSTRQEVGTAACAPTSAPRRTASASRTAMPSCERWPRSYWNSPLPGRDVAGLEQADHCEQREHRGSSLAAR